MSTDADIAYLHAHLRGLHTEERAEGCPACQRLPEVSAPAQTPVRKNPPAPGRGRLCQCECGEPVSATARFRPGHDAKLKSRLVKSARAGDSEARERLVELGWIKFL